MGKARGKAQTDWIGDENKYNWYVRGCVLCGARGLRSEGENEIGFRSNEISSERWKLVETIIRILALDDDGSSFDPADLTKLIQESVIRTDIARRGAQHSDTRHSRRRFGCGCRREHQQHEREDRHRSDKSLHSITVPPHQRECESRGCAHWP